MFTRMTLILSKVSQKFSLPLEVNCLTKEVVAGNDKNFICIFSGVIFQKLHGKHSVITILVLEYSLCKVMNTETKKQKKRSPATAIKRVMCRFC